MDISLDNLLKRAKMESKLDGSSVSVDNYIKLLLALQPYGYAKKEFDEIHKYYIEPTDVEHDAEYNKYFKYFVKIIPTYMYRIDGWYIMFKVHSIDGEDDIAIGYVYNHNEDLLLHKIKNNNMHKYDFITITHTVLDYLEEKFPNIDINKIYIIGSPFSRIFDSVNELENCNENMFNPFRCFQNGDT